MQHSNARRFAAAIAAVIPRLIIVARPACRDFADGTGAGGDTAVGRARGWPKAPVPRPCPRPAPARAVVPRERAR